MSTAAIILAAGIGRRFLTETPKQYSKVSGKLILEHTLDVFENNEKIDEIYLVVHENYVEKTKEIATKNSYKKIKNIIIGGDTRQESSKLGLSSCNENIENVLIHDSVRPYIDNEIINSIIEKLNMYSVVDIAIPTADTIIEVKDKIISNIPERKYLYRGQTPQGFKLDLIKKAHILADRDGYADAPDDCSLILRYNLSDVYVVEGSEYNIKITNPLDIYIADKISQIKNLKMEAFTLDTIKEKLKDKVVVVFGGSSGIGLDIVDIAKKSGASAYSCSRKNEVDITNYNDIEKSLQNIFEKHGHIDHIINTVGLMKMGPIETIPIEEINEQIKTNLIGSFYVAKASIRYLKDSRGSLTLFSSSSYSRGRSGYIPYSSSKAAIVNIAQGLSDELSCFDIKVNVICPERTSTPLRRKNFGKEDESLLLSSKYVAIVTLRTIISNVSGAIVDVKKLDENKENL